MCIRDSYSTGNQMLSEKEFGHMAVLGRESMVRAVNEHFQWLFEGFEFPEPAPRPTPTVTEPTPSSREPDSEPLVAEAMTMADDEQAFPTEPLVAEAMAAAEDTSAEPEVVESGEVVMFLAPRPRDTPTAADGSAEV